MRSRALGCLLAAAMFLGSFGARANESSAADRATARELAQQGQDALDNNRYELAVDRFSRAYALVHAPTLLLGLAHAYLGLGKLVEAEEAYNRIIHTGVAPNAPRPFVKALEDAKKEIDGVAARLAWVTIQVKGPSAPDVTIDGVAVPSAALGVKRAINPGSHEVRAGAPGYQGVKRTIQVAEGGSTSVTFDLDPLPPSTEAAASAKTSSSLSPSGLAPTPKPASPHRTLAFVLLGAGGAALATGAVTGVLALQKHNELVEKCPHNVCSVDLQATGSAYKTFGLISTIGVAAGAAGVGAALYFLLKPSSSDSASSASSSTTPHGTHVHPYIGFGSAGLKGTFD